MVSIYQQVLSIQSNDGNDRIMSTHTMIEDDNGLISKECYEPILPDIEGGTGVI